MTCLQTIKNFIMIISGVVFVFFSFSAYSQDITAQTYFFSVTNNPAKIQPLSRGLWRIIQIGYVGGRDGNSITCTNQTNQTACPTALNSNQTATFKIRPFKNFPNMPGIIVVRLESPAFKGIHGLTCHDYYDLRTGGITGAVDINESPKSPAFADWYTRCNS